MPQNLGGDKLGGRGHVKVECLPSTKLREVKHARKHDQTNETVNGTGSLLFKHLLWTPGGISWCVNVFAAVE